MPPNSRCLNSSNSSTSLSDFGAERSYERVHGWSNLPDQIDNFRMEMELFRQIRNRYVGAKAQELDSDSHTHRIDIYLHIRGHLDGLRNGIAAELNVRGPCFIVHGQSHGLTVWGIHEVPFQATDFTVTLPPE